MFMCACIHICVFTVSVHVCMCSYVCVHMCVCSCVHVCMYSRVHVFICVRSDDWFPNICVHVMHLGDFYQQLSF